MSDVELIPGRKADVMQIARDLAKDLENGYWETVEDVIACGIDSETWRIIELLEEMPDQTIRLHCGELTAQEMRFVRAIFGWLTLELQRPPNPQ